MKAKTKSSRQSKINSESLQEKFNVNVGDIQKAIKGVKKFRAENPKLQSQLFEEERVPLFLQLSCIKIPKGYSQILRIPLPHTILTPEDEICLIVPDVKGIKNIEHEKHVEHYEDLLRKGGVTNIKKIMTFHELRTEYETFEQKSRLVDLYDIFLADGRISGRAIKKCGKVFYKKRKVPISVKLYATKLKENIEKALTKVFFHLHLKGNSFTVQFGHDKMKVDDLVENVYSVIEFLDIKFPGGFANIKGIQVSSPRATSIPIYLNFKSPSEVKVAKVKSKRPKAYKSYEDEITTLYNAKVTVRPSGEVLVKRIRKKSKIRNDNVITDEDLINDNK